MKLPSGCYRLASLDLEVSLQRADDQLYTMELRQENATQTATRNP